MDIDVHLSHMDGDERELFQEIFDITHARFNGYVFAEKLKEHMDSILKMNVRDDDVWICSFPKTGTIWTTEMVYCVANENGVTKALQKPFIDRCVFLDSCCQYPEKIAKFNEKDTNNVKQLLSSGGLSKDQSARFVYTHLPYELLPQKLRDGSSTAKIVYVTRNPRDACISFFHHLQKTRNLNKNLKDFSEMYMKGSVPSAPFWRHVLGFWNRRNDRNVLYIKYEDMKQDISSVIQKTATFFKKNLTDEQIKLLCQHLSFDTMKKNSALYAKPTLTSMVKNQINLEGTEKFKFFREGKSDQWKNVFEPEILDRFDQWECDNLKHLNLKSYFDL